MNLLTAYLADMRGTLAPSTLKTYELTLRHMPSLPVSLADARAYKSKRMDEVSPASVVVNLRALKSFDKWFANEMDEPELLTKLTFPRVTINDHAPIILEDQYRRLLAASESRRDTAILAILWSTGMRLSEVARLQVEDIDLERGTVMVRETKNGHSRVAYLDNESRRYVRRHVLTNSGPLWQGKRGDCTKAMIEDVLKRLCVAAGVSVTAHQFRRALAQRWLSQGGSETLLAAVAGWRSPTMIGRYVRAMKTELALGEAQRLFG